MIARPATLENWTLGLVAEIAATGIHENDWYDFKADLQGKPEHQRKVVAAFANTQGGFLVFGVTNAREVVGVENPELPRDFGNKLTHGLNPSVEVNFAALAMGAKNGVWICHVPRSRRGPHGVLANDHWTFPRRTESGSNVSMNVEEIRNAFLDAGRRENELSWLKAEIGRVCEIAERLDRETSTKTSNDLNLILSRFDVNQLKVMLPSVFGFIGQNTILVEYLHDMIERCAKVDAVLTPLAAFAFLPRDRSYSGSGIDWRAILVENAAQIANAARHARRDLEALLK